MGKLYLFYCGMQLQVLGRCDLVPASEREEVSADMAAAAAGSAGRQPGDVAAVKQCAGCGADILDRYLLNAIDAFWHTGCLRCAICHAALADIGSTCFTRAGLILCKPDYLRSVVCELETVNY